MTGSCKYLAVFAAVSIAAFAAPTEDFRKDVGKVSLGLYTTVAKNSPGNVVLSPLSVQTALALVYLGADGETAREMSQVLRLNEDEAVTAANFKSLLDSHADSGVVKVANKVYLDKTFDVKPAFAQLAADNFYSGAETVDYSNGEEAARTMNAWVEEKTNNKVKDLVKAEDVQDAKSTLVNAVYFKANWAQEFSPESTFDTDFWLSKTETKKVDMMRKTLTVPYAEFDNFKAVKLHYKDADFALVVLLPSEKDGLSALEARFAEQQADVNSLLSYLQPHGVNLDLPKFKTEFSVDLTETLKQLGLKSMFTDQANFEKLSSHGVKVGKVLHKAVFEVDEKGTEAAAATVAVTFDRAAFVPFDVKNFVADHPFLYLLVDSNGHVFFAGHYVG